MFLLQERGAYLFLVITITALAINSITGQPTFHFCSGESNDPANTSYQTNLGSLLSSLASKAAVETFYNDTSNGIFGLYLCRGNVTNDECQSCVNNASQILRNLCPSNKEAIVWYDKCMLRYSNVNFFGLAQQIVTVLMYNIRNTSSPYDEDTSALGLMYTLINEAINTEMMYRAGALPAGNLSDRYGLVQCSRDISSVKCSNCLTVLMDLSRDCCQKQRGWRLLTPSCNLRYEEYAFFSSPSAPPVSDAPPVPPTKGKNTTKIILITVPVTTAVLALFALYLYRSRPPKDQETSQEILFNHLKGWTGAYDVEGAMDVKDQDNSGEMHYFRLTTLQIATSNFSDANKLGQGGFGPVYKGKLPDGKEIAIKRLSRNSGQGLEEFKTEVKYIVKLQHRNLVRLIGCCIEGEETLLVYEYMANTSLDAFLFNSTKCRELDWAKRENIVHGIARGLLYLHEDSRLKIIHRDLKASNVLLDDEMNPKISDFGTARAFYAKQIEASTNRIVGTYGYMAPEYAMEGLFSIKSDVYSFGVLMLEVISGRRNSDFSLPTRAQSLLRYAWRLWNDGKAEELIDGNLISAFPGREAVRWINIALLCVQEDPEDRPSMSKVVHMLGSQSDDLPKPSEPPFSVGRYTMFDQSSSIKAVTGYLSSDLASTSASTS